VKTRVDKAANVAIKTASLTLVSLATFVVGLARQRRAERGGVRW
jgi:hypothetical protein